MATRRVLPDVPLYSVAVDSEIADEIGRGLPRKWTTMSPCGTRSAVRTARSRLGLVLHTAARASTSNNVDSSGAAEVVLASEIVDFAFSQCGEFLAVADAGGMLRLIKSESARELFAYPIVAPSALASDSIQAVVFAERAAAAVVVKDADVGGEMPEDLLVLTRAGVLIRLGNLRLAEIERTLAREASHNVALRSIMASIHLQQAHVGRLRDGAKSIMLGLRYSSSLFVTVANHEDALRVWRADTSGRQKDPPLRLQAAYETLIDGTCVADVQFAIGHRCLTVLSDGGSLSWWDWRTLILLYSMDIGRIESFAALETRVPRQSASVIALSCAVQGENVDSSIQVVQLHHCAASRLFEVVETLSIPAKSTANVVSMSTGIFTTGGTSLLLTEVNEGSATTFVMNLLAKDEEGQIETTTDDLGGVSPGVRCGQETRALVLSSLCNTHAFDVFEEKLKRWFTTVGQDLEDSRIIIESLVEFGKRLRQEQSSPSSLPPTLEQRLPDWLERIASVSYRWTTFTLLLPTVTDSKTSLQSVAKRWRDFCNANLLDVMCYYLKRGMMRAVSLLWQRHTHHDALECIDKILASVPRDLSFSAYETWLRGDVVPGIVRYAERQSNLGSSTAAEVVNQFASWVVQRIKYFAAQGDIDTALQLCHILKPGFGGEASYSGDTSLQWVFMRLSAPSTKALSDESARENALECVEHLYQQLEHMKYLDTQHSFKISLEVFTQETPVTIAMSMLDRCASAEMVSSEIHGHIAPYLRYCGRGMDSVLQEYVTEALESAASATSTSEQARLMSIIEEIVDVENRTSTTLLFFGSLLPPFSSHVRQFTRKCLGWDTRQIDVVQEHVRLMDIQDMLTSYGVGRFQVGDARGGSRLVSHILAQITRESAFADALQLVRAYSHLSAERAALEYFENMLTIESASFGLPVEAVASRRGMMMKSAIKQVKSVLASAGTSARIVAVLEETVTLGLNLLEMKEADAETRPPKSSARGSSSASLGDEVFLKILETSIEVFIAELEDVDVAVTDDKWGCGDAEAIDGPNNKLLSDIQRIRRMHNDWGVLVSVSTLRNPDRVSKRVRAFIQPYAMFSAAHPGQDVAKSTKSRPAGKGKKRALGSDITNNIGESVKKPKLAGADGLSFREHDEQQDDQQARLAFDLHRYAAHIGMAGDDYHSLVAQVAAEHGDILKAVQYSRDLFSTRRGVSAISKREESGNAGFMTSTSGLALKNISLSISKYTAMHTDEIYSLATQGHGQERRTLTPVQLARMQAPLYSLELLQYAICVCDQSSFEETFLLLKSATLSNDILKFTQLSNFGGSKRLDEEKLRIYDRWFREDTLCVLPSAQTMNLATRFAIAEHRLLVSHSTGVPIGVLDHSAPIPVQDFLASKRFVSFLVENNADLLSLQVILSMRWIPEDALSVVQSQVIKLVSTVFQSRKIDNFLALGLMLAMDQKDAFNAFRRQISRENVAKDFNRFQQLAKIGSDSARAWQQVAFLNQCVELEGNARWWHFLNLLEIECDHKAFQSERRDLNYIRSLVPTLLAKSSYDYYTIQEFTRHYQIDDSYPALVYVEALLTVPEATARSQEYQDKIVGVLEDIHEQRLVALLLKTLPKVSGTDYERLLFMFQLLLEHTSYADKEEVERRIEVLHVLKAFAASESGSQPLLVNADDCDAEATAKQGECESHHARNTKRTVCFHRMMTKPRDVLSEILTTQSFAILSNLDYPLRLESDELLMLLLKNVVAKHRAEVSLDASTNSIASSSALSGSELERLFGILGSLKAVESKVTAGEWLAENLPISSHKLRSLEFALEAAAASSSDNSAAHRRHVPGKQTFLGIEALTRLEEKVLRTKVQLIFAEKNITNLVGSIQETNLLKLVSKQPKEVFYELYRSAGASVPSTAVVHNDFSIHKVANRVASVLNLRPNELRIDLVRELLVKDAVYIPQRQDGQRAQQSASQEVIFTLLEQEERDARDEKLINKISSIAVFVAQESQTTADPTDAISLIEYLVSFARDTKPRAGVTFRAKFRAARAVLQLAQSHQAIVIAAVETKMKLAAFDAVIKELVDYIRHCKHMIIFEENRVPYEIGFVMRAKKEALVRSLLRQHSGREEWILRCVASLMLDFDVQAPDLWEFVLTTMKQQKMFRSLSRVLNGLSAYSFVRSINGASEIWEATLLSPLLYLQSLAQPSSVVSMEVDTNSSTEFHGIPLENIRLELELMVQMLQKCPFLEQIDVASFVVRLRDISNVTSALSSVDLFSYAVRCTMVIPRPSIRLEALQRIIQSGAYMQVLNRVCDPSVFAEEAPTADSSEKVDSDHVSEQLAILEAIFNEASKREEHEKLLGSPFEQGFLEFLTLTGTIDRALAIVLTEKRLEAASTLVELYYESNPESAPSGWSATESTYEGTGENSGRWSVLQQYVAASTSSHLATYRQMTS